LDNLDILTVTPNPSLDLLHETDRVVWDDANRVAEPRRRPGGQGINVARAARAMGGTAAIVTPLGGRTGEGLRQDIEQERIPLYATEAPGETRVFAALREIGTGRNMLINPRGPTFGADDVERFLHQVKACIRDLRPRWVACCGSLPPGFPPDLYRTIKSTAAAKGARFVADCDGAALELAAAGGCDLLVPNRYEAGRLTGTEVDTIASGVAAARSILAGGTPVVVVTLGADGAVLVTAELAIHGRVEAEGAGAGAAVGAGDSFLAAYLLKGETTADPRAALASAVAAGTSVLSSQGRELMDVTAWNRLIERVAITEVG
jgi:1-phosphofructokinase family hexose kinase